MRRYRRIIGLDAPLPPPLEEDVIHGLKLAARAGRPGVLSMQRNLGLEDDTPDVFVETWVILARAEPENVRVLHNFALMAILEMEHQDDPERALRAMIEIPTLNPQERAAARDSLAEYLHYKGLPDKAARDFRKGL
jgi:hypothetical protein